MTVLKFPTFRTLAAVNVNGHVYGYMDHHKRETRLHLAAKSPWWLQQVRNSGPFESHGACQDALRKAAPQ